GWIVQRKLDVGPRALHQLAQRVARVALADRTQAVVEPLIPSGGDRGDQRLLVGVVRVWRGVADPGAQGDGAQAQRMHAFGGQNIYPGRDQRVFQIAVVVIFLGHRRLSGDEATRKWVFAAVLFL